MTVKNFLQQSSQVLSWDWEVEVTCSTRPRQQNQNDFQAYVAKYGRMC